MSENTFVVYNASAGSGKTFTLVKSYLKTLFSSRDVNKYKRILAITFTNKAVAEMKGRILENLKAFSTPEILLKEVPDNLKGAQQMFVIIAEELQIDHSRLHQKAIRIQETILNNYAAFDVVTIDTFTHRLIRTFAYDLKLPQNFEVALDTEDVLQEAISNVLAKVGEDDDLTKLLINFATQKADDLKKISGVGPVMEQKLHQLGIYTFDQVSRMTKTEYDLLDSIIDSFPGRAERDDWAGQANTLKNK